MSVDLVNFLSPETPAQDADMEAVWVDRQSELAQALAHVAAVIANAPQKPLAIVGGARVGKSHMLRRVEKSSRDRFDISIRARITYNYHDIRALLVTLLDQVISKFQEAFLEKRIDQQLLRPIVEIRHRFSALMTENAQKLTIQEGDSLLTTLSLNISGKASAKVASQTLSLGQILGLPMAEGQGELGASGAYQRTSSNTKNHTIEYTKFDAEQISRLIMLTHRLVRDGYPNWKTLLVVDDFDLLKRESDDTLDPKPLLKTLAQLSQEDGLFILTTVRQDTYDQQEKDFYEIVQLRPFRDPKHLEEIFQRHCALWNDESKPFSEKFIKEASHACRGRVGLFLNLLRSAFNLHGGTVTQELDAYLESEWSFIREQEPEKAALLETAVQGQAGRIKPDDLSKLRKSSLKRWIFEDYSSHDAAQVNFILQQHLLKKNGPPAS